MERKPIQMSDEINPLISLHNLCSFNVRDWSTDKGDAWIYGIVCGWGNAIHEVAKSHGWDRATVTRLRKLPTRYKALQALK